MEDKTKINEIGLICNYSGLPSPLSYCADYDSMGNHGRFPNVKPIKKNSLLNKLKNYFKK